MKHIINKIANTSDNTKMVVFAAASNIVLFGLFVVIPSVIAKV